jgi:hypothetical protein
MVCRPPTGRTLHKCLTYDTVAYGSETWMRMHDMWVLWEKHGMVYMLLTRRAVRVFQARANIKIR